MTRQLSIDDRGGGVLQLTIDREDRRNSLDDGVIGEFRAILSEAAEDSSLRAIVIAGRGRKAFCAGSDVKALRDLSLEEQAQHTRRGQELMDSLVDHPCLVVAAVEGFAVGGGFELALACDLIVASSDAVFGFPEVTRGMLPAWGGTYRLASSVGLLAAKASILGGRRWSAEEAERLGLLLEVCAPGEAATRAVDVASALASVADREAFALAKALLNVGGGNRNRSSQLLETLGEAVRALSPGYGA